MRKRLTLTIDQDVYERLRKASGKRNTSGFIEDLLRQHVIRPHLEASHTSIAKDEPRQTAAAAWKKAAMDPLFLKDLDDVAADFGESRHQRSLAPRTPDT